MKDILMIFPLVVLLGLCFVVFIGRRRRTSDGTIVAPAPGSPQAPIFAQPEKEKSHRR